MLTLTLNFVTKSHKSLIDPSVDLILGQARISVYIFGIRNNCVHHCWDCLWLCRDQTTDKMFSRSQYWPWLLVDWTVYVTGRNEVPVSHCWLSFLSSLTIVYYRIKKLSTDNSSSTVTNINRYDRTYRNGTKTETLKDSKGESHDPVVDTDFERDHQKMLLCLTWGDIMNTW